MKPATLPSETISSNVFSVARGVWGVKDLFVNYYFIQNEYDGTWVLIDAGLKWSSNKIKEIAGQLFGQHKPPIAILLTHGHFDHVGSAATLANFWNVPIYAHTLELPYLTGVSAYPPADPSVGGGIMSSMSWTFPRGPVDLHSIVKALPDNNTIPGMPEWKFIHTPGHSPGHISLFRESDKTLIAGDAFVTTKQESALYALTYKKHLSGPPKYFTCNWASAKISVLKLAALDPEVVATGHGYPMYGSEMRNALQLLGTRFEKTAQPSHGRYVNEPAISDEMGLQFVPPPVEKIPMAIKLIGLGIAVASIAIALSRARGSSQRALSKSKRQSRRYKTLDLAFANL